MKTILSIAFASLLSIGTGAFAADAASATKLDGTVMPASADMTSGEVRKVDLDAKKITLKHEEIKNLGMPGMTMVFQVRDPSMLDNVKAGDKVKFTAEKINGAFTVTSLEAAK
jgi:Cu/Ag efflux protein CusF